MFDELTRQAPRLPFWFRMVQAGEHENLMYAFGDEDTGEAWLVDPAWELEAMRELVESEGFTIRRALFTHGHWDHIGGAPWCAAHGIECVVHEAGVGNKNLAEAHEARLVRPVRDGDVLQLGSVPVQVLHTPGHQPEAACYLVGAGDAPRALFGGDTLFIGSCGRTDFPGGDTNAMFASMARLRDLGGDVHVMPGHHYAKEPTRSLSDEVRENPALATTDRSAFEALPFLRG